MKLGCTESGKDRDESKARVMMMMMQKKLEWVAANFGNLTVRSAMDTGKGSGSRAE